MFYCNSCDKEMKRTSKNNHLKTKIHNKNAEKIPLEQPVVVYAKDIDNSLYKTYPITYYCSFCGVNNKELFYELNTSCCRSCKYKRGREEHKREYYY